MGTDLEIAVRKFFSHLWVPVGDEATIPAVFSPVLPVVLKCPITPLLAEGERLALFAANLF
jgi:hypothetical protein